MDMKEIQELLPMLNPNNNITVLGRDLHEFLEIGWDYSTWMKRMCEYGFIEGVDYSILKNDKAYVGALSRIDHQLTMDMAKEISVMQKNEKGKQARQYVIECEKKLRHNTYIEAIEAIIVKEKAKQLIEG
jgi:phage anti-repressor protein